jgi:hypothetical protein
MSEVRWWRFAICNNMDTEDFFDNYEASPQVAQAIDEVCLSCPVMYSCFKEGVEEKKTGVWGGVYLLNGKKDRVKNSHKTPRVWERIERKLRQPNNG